MKNAVAIAALAAVALALGLGLWQWQQSGGGRELAAATRLDRPRPLPEVQLLDQNGDRFGRSGFEGRWHLLFFGFTHCPDICPNTLGLLKQVRRALDEPRLRIVFISLDPKRDTPARLREYAGYFDPEFLALTGEEAQLQKLSKALYMPYAVTQPDAAGNYSVDHSANLVLLNPAAQVVAYFSAPHEAAAVTVDLWKLMTP